MKLIIIWVQSYRFFLRHQKKSVLKCYDNSPLRASFRALYSTSHR